jgi:hypothetical protein
MISMRTSRAGLALVVLFSALLSAALAHLAIDVLGDFMLAHDAYDGMQHTSRSVLACLALATAAAFAFRQLFGALDASTAGRRRAVQFIGAMLPRRLLPFAAATAGLALLALCAMEFVDASAAGIRVDDPGDLLGGSLVLGSLILIACATATAGIVFAALRALAGLTVAVVRAVHALFMRRATAAAKPLAHRRLARTFALHPQLARRATKRGPPLLRSL